MNNGIIAINKPAGWTSFDVVNKIKYMAKPNKVGHLGTLDPMATGVLLVTVGKATKLFDIMQEKTKTYIATFEFGYETDSLDATGKKTNENEIVPTSEQIKSVLPKFIGKIDQIPPQFSAKSVNGVRAYQLARKGETVELKPKQVNVENIKLLSFKDNKLILEIVCGSGTYIRAIGRDIAYSLGCFATMTELKRTKVGSFNLENCKDITTINKDNLKQNLISLDKVLDYIVLNLDEITTKKLLNGQTVQLTQNNGKYFLKYNQEIVAIINIQDFKAKMLIFLAWKVVNNKKICYNKKVENCL